MALMLAVEACKDGGDATQTTQRAWPNDPLAVGTPGWTLLTDYDMSAPLPVGGDQPIPGGQGWKIAGNGPPNTTAAWLISDPGAPFSPPSVYAFQYSAGMAMGSAPATIYYDGFSTSEAYVGYWWKPSSNFFIGPVGTKITFMFNYGGSGGAYLIFHPGNVVEMSTFGQSTGYLNWDANVTATPVTLGQWCCKGVIRMSRWTTRLWRFNSARRSAASVHHPSQRTTGSTLTMCTSVSPEAGFTRRGLVPSSGPHVDRSHDAALEESTRLRSEGVRFVGASTASDLRSPARQMSRQ